MTGSPSWLKTGTAATAEYKAVQLQQEQAKALREKMRRFYLKENEEKIVTFLDGDLGADGVLMMTAMNEHSVKLGANNWQQFICTADTEICPLCQDGNRADYVGVFTVLNHTPYTIQNGPNKGKVLGDRRELYVAKMGTLKKLQNLAGKRGGLTGWRVEIGRGDDKDPKVGSMFQFMERSSMDELASKYGEDGAPADYGKELTYMTAQELLAAGVGKAPSGPGFSKGGGKISDADLSDQM